MTAPDAPVCACTMSEACERHTGQQPMRLAAEATAATTVAWLRLLLIEDLAGLGDKPMDALLAALHDATGHVTAHLARAARRPIITKEDTPC